MGNISSGFITILIKHNNLSELKHNYPTFGTEIFLKWERQTLMYQIESKQKP
mgnify:CR=1 FL=1